MNAVPGMEQLFQLFDQLPPAVLEQAVREIPREVKRRKEARKLEDYRPYPKQAEFHAAGGLHRERLLMAGNQLGKTYSAGCELAMHLTGRYPPDWCGKRFAGATRWLAGSESAELTRKGIQRILLGPPEVRDQWGTGTIPRECLIDTSPRPGVADAVSAIMVRNDLDEQVSVLQLASYDQGRTKWQADTLDGVWFDEEPPEDVYIEGVTRTNTTMGPVMMTLTPLLGVSAVVRRFLIDKVAGTHVTNMTIDDAEHYTPEQRAAIIATYPAHEREARTKGIPSRGSGSVFPLSLEQILCPSFPIPDHWAQGCAIDFGWDHPSAGVRLAFDRDSDVLYVTAAYKAREQTPLMFAGAVKPWGEWLNWFWPHDGHQSGGKFGAQDQAQLAVLYRKQGLRMFMTHATFENGTNSVEAGITEMLERMQTGRLLIFNELREWQEEFSLYHRKDGVIVKEHDDLISATRYGMMMRRHFKTRAETDPARKPKEVNAPAWQPRARGDGLDWMV